MCNLMQTVGPTTTTAVSSSDRPHPAKRYDVRAATILDAPAIAEIHNQYVAAGPYTMEESRWTAVGVKTMLSHASDREAMLVCVDSAALNQQNDVVGWAKIKHYSDRAGYRVACESSVYVDRRVRGCGVGDLLLCDLLHVAKRLNYRHVTARIIVGNRPSIRLHLKHGFTAVGVQNGIGVIDGQPADVLLMQHTDQLN